MVKKFSLPCGAVLIDGSCIVNEGMLTGATLEFEMLEPCAGYLSGRCLYLFFQQIFYYLLEQFAAGGGKNVA